MGGDIHFCATTAKRDLAFVLGVRPDRRRVKNAGKSEYF
jgi:hypothetical protein